MDRPKDDRQWVYHELTDEGEALASADRPRVVIELGTSLVLVAAGAAVVGARTRLAEYYGAGSEKEGAAAAPDGGDGSATGGPSPASLPTR